MAAFRKVLTNWWTLTLAAAAIVALILCVGVPLVAAFARPWWVRLLALLLVAAVWGGFALVRVLAARKASERIARGLAEADRQDGEGATLSRRMAEALAQLRMASGGKRDYLYTRPWYVIIGPPGAGKTTALVRSGLRYPLSDTALKGVAGTRNLDFWFADEAVLVDTAGRYTSQDTSDPRDTEGWRAFLDLLKRNRPLQPINGVLVAMPLDQILQADVATIDQHAATIRRRLDELRTGLEVSPPVYLMFTKTDLLAGFSEFFDDLDVEGRRAVLGSTLPLDDRRVSETDFALAFDAVAQAVADRCARRLQDELDPRRRALILGFAPQVEALRSRVVRLLGGVFAEEGRTEPAIVRGFYFTSGVQEGTPLDRIVASVAAVYDAPQQPVAGASGRAFFLNRLLKDVVFGEAGLVRVSPALIRRRRTTVAAALAGIGAVSLLIVSLWLTSYFANRKLQDEVSAGARDIARNIRDRGIDLVQVGPSDAGLEDVEPVLTLLRDLPRGYGARRRGGPPLAMRFGLFQSGLSRRAEEAYLEGLRRILLPRVTLRQEEALRENAATPLALYEPLKAYLMLGGLAPKGIDAPTVKGWVTADWADTALAGGDRAAARGKLADHLDALLKDRQIHGAWPERKAPLDWTLITASRRVVASMPVSDRAYAILKQGAGDGEDWAPGIGASAAAAFAAPQRVQALTVPYFFTRKGYEGAYQLGLRTLDLRLKQDAWVLGDDEQGAFEGQMRSLRASVANLYAGDYVAHWNGVVEALAPADYFNDPVAAGAATGAAPLKSILLQVRDNTSFSGSNQAAAIKGAQAKLMQKAPGVQGMNIEGGDGGADAGRQIQQAFKPLHDYVGDGKTPAPIDAFTAKLKAAVTAQNAAGPGLGGFGLETNQAALGQAMAELRMEAAQAPVGPLQGFAAQASKQGDRAQISSAQGAIGGQYEAIRGLCQASTQGRYPFVAAAAADTPMGDVQRLFGSNGALDGFIGARVQPLVDPTGAVWRWRPDAPLAAGLDPSSAEQFQKAVQIRDLLLSGVAVKVEAVAFGGAVTGVEINSGGAVQRLEAGASTPRTLTWSAANAGAPVELTLLQNGKPLPPPYSADGPWALFRLFDAARAKENAGASAFRATFGEGASYATLKVSLAPGPNPFSRAFWSFRCPPRV